MFKGPRIPNWKAKDPHFINWGEGEAVNSGKL